MSLIIFKVINIILIIGFLLISTSFLFNDNDDKLTSLALKIKKKGLENIDGDRVRPYNALYKVIIPVFLLLTVYIPLSLFVQLLYVIFVKMIYNKLPNAIKSFFEFIISFIIYTYFLCFYYFVKIICCCTRDDVFWLTMSQHYRRDLNEYYSAKPFSFRNYILKIKIDARKFVFKDL